MTVGELIIELVAHCPMDAALDLELWHPEGRVLRLALEGVGDLREGRVPLQAVLPEE
jgi:hypothetical protein